jgi:hypothetical protein
MQMSFGTLELAERLNRDNVLLKIEALIEWEELRPKLTGLYKRELSHGGGQEPFDALIDRDCRFRQRGRQCHRRHRQGCAYRQDW